MNQSVRPRKKSALELLFESAEDRATIQALRDFALPFIRASRKSDLSAVVELRRAGLHAEADDMLRDVRRYSQGIMAFLRREKRAQGALSAHESFIKTNEVTNAD